MRNLQAVLSDTEAEPLSMNRRLEQVARLSTLDNLQLGMLTGIPELDLDQFFAGELLLCGPELSALVRVLRDTLHANNARLARLLAARRPRKIRRRRDAEQDAASCATARAARRTKRSRLAGDEDGGGVTLPPPPQSEAVACG